MQKEERKKKQKKKKGKRRTLSLEKEKKKPHKYKVPMTCMTHKVKQSLSHQPSPCLNLSKSLRGCALHCDEQKPNQRPMK